MAERTGKRLLDLAEAAELLRLSPDAVRALVAADYLVPAGQAVDGPEFAPSDLKGFLARNTGGGSDSFPEVEVGPDLTSLLDAIRKRIDEMAQRSFEIFSQSVPETALWTDEERER